VVVPRIIVAIAAATIALLPARAGAVESGVGIAIRTDLDDSSSGDAHLRFRPGPAIRVPLRWDIGNGVFVRSALEIGANPGQDRVEWKRFMGEITVYSDDHWTFLSSASLVLGPELSMLQTDKLRMLWGVSGGLVSAQMWHSFDSRAVDIFDLEKNDLSDPRNIDPYSNQLTALVGTHANFSIWTRPELAIELEVGYNVCLLREVALQKAEDEVEAVRSAMGLNFFRLGVSFIRGKESGAVR
jgi:hypothetical protein